jgi:ATP-dependent DNA helicase PIF1
MFSKAVQKHDAAIPATTSSLPSKQQSLGSALARNAIIHNTVAHPLGSGIKHIGAGTQGATGVQTHGVKRTSSGFAKQLSSQDDMFNYPTLNILGMEKENQHPIAYNAPARSTNAGLATKLFDEDDFDSDVDLDIEDPATKGTVSYPELPQTASNSSEDSGYLSRPPTAHHSKVADSSQPIPWSSSPAEHFKTPQKPEPLKPRTRRAHLPWSQNQQMRTQQEPEDRIESDEEVARPKKRQSTEAKQEVESTPKSKSQYPWNTTASALKLQQKNLRELNKKSATENEAVMDDVTAAIRKKKKNTVHRIFLSEEQQNVLNLVTEYKKSVFFTGSAGMSVSRILQTRANSYRYW